jgi:hypothetical protein
MRPRHPPGAPWSHNAPQPTPTSGSAPWSHSARPALIIAAFCLVSVGCVLDVSETSRVDLSTAEPTATQRNVLN